MSIFLFLMLLASCASQLERTPGPAVRIAEPTEPRHHSQFFKRFGTRAQTCIKSEECEAEHTCSSNGARGYGFCLISCKDSPCPEGLECTAVGDSVHGLAFDVCDTPKKVTREEEEYFERRNREGPLVDILFPRSLFPDDLDPEEESDDLQPLPARDE